MTTIVRGRRLTEFGPRTRTLRVGLIVALGHTKSCAPADFRDDPRLDFRLWWLAADSDRAILADHGDSSHSDPATSLTVGQTSQFTVTATLSDGTTQDVSTSAAWQSNTGIVSVSIAGAVTAVSSGTATITATYQGKSSDLAVTVVGGAGSGDGVSSQVRVLYVVPQDRAFRSDYAVAVEKALTDLQSWYRTQLTGRTFSLFNSQPETCRLLRPADYYARDTWSKVLTDVQSCAPVSYGSSGFAWVLYVDVLHTCNAPGRLGAGTTGITMMPRQDLDGLIGARVIDDCGMEWRQPIARYIGGAGHELGHALGLDHPPGCDQGRSSCDHNALMWTGYARYPNTYLREDDRRILLASPFIR